MKYLSAFIFAIIISLTGVGGIAADSSSESLPLIVAFANPTDDEETPSNSEVVVAIIEHLRDTGKAEVMAFNRELPVVARAILERRLDNQTVNNASDPKNALQISAVMGAKYALCIQGSVANSEVTVSLQMLEVPSGQSWTSLAKTEIVAGGGPRDSIVRSNAISTAASSAVSQIAIAVFGQVAMLDIQTPASDTSPSGSTRRVPASQTSEDRLLEYTQIMKQVDSYMQKNDFTNAIVELRRAINLEPHNSTPRARLALLYIDLGMTAEATDECMRALLFDKENIEIREVLIKLYVQSNALDKAAELCREVISLQPENIDARLALGDLYWNQRQIDNAENAYVEAVEIAPDSSAAHERLQRLYMARRNYTSAFEHMLKTKTLAAGENSDASDSYKILAQIVQDEFDVISGKLESAERDFERNTITREEYYRECMDVTGRVDALAHLLASSNAPDSFRAAHPHGVLAVSLLAQAAGYVVSYLETEQQHYAEQSGLLKSEAKTELMMFSGAIRRT